MIENQLERSDHDHLGKLITYLAAFEARTAIWSVSDPRPEHVGAITWLNESFAANFFIEGPDAEANTRIFEVLEAMLRLDRTFRPRIQALRV